MAKGTPGNQGTFKKKPKPIESVPTSKPLSRSSIEAYAFGGIAIALGVFPMTWWFRGILLLILGGIVIDLIRRSPVTIGWSPATKGLLHLIVAGIVGYSGYLSWVQAQPKTKSDASRAQGVEELAAIDRMTLHDMFNKDFAGLDRATKVSHISPQGGHPGFDFEYVKVGSALYKSNFLIYYIPTAENTAEFCAWLATQADDLVNGGAQFNYTTKVPGDSGTLSTADEVFSGNVYIYHETYLPEEEIVALTKRYKNYKQSVIFRSIDYLYTKKLEMKLALKQR